jgi:hypothetical protein
MDSVHDIAEAPPRDLGDDVAIVRAPSECAPPRQPTAANTHEPIHGDPVGQYEIQGRSINAASGLNERLGTSKIADDLVEAAQQRHLSLQ